MTEAEQADKLSGADAAEAAIRIHLAEYDKIKNEIGQRSQAQHSLLLLNVSALGVLFSIAVGSSIFEIMLSLPFVYSFTLLEWSNHGRQIQKLGRYVDKDLRPKLELLTGGAFELLHWSQWGRESPLWRSSWLHRIVATVAHHLVFAGGMAVGLGASFPLLTDIVKRSEAMKAGYWTLWILALVVAVSSYLLSELSGRPYFGSLQTRKRE